MGPDMAGVFIVRISVAMDSREKSAHARVSILLPYCINSLQMLLSCSSFAIFLGLQIFVICNFELLTFCLEALEVTRL